MPPRRKQPAELVSLVDIVETVKNGIENLVTLPNLRMYNPHEKQVLFHNSDKWGRLFIGGNRSGKSVGGVTEGLMRATRRHPTAKLPRGEIRGRVVVSNFTDHLFGIIFPIYKQWVIPSDLINGSWEDSWNANERTLTFDNGNFIDFKSTDQDLVKHAGTSRHWVHFDEECPMAYFNENNQRLIDTNGVWWMTMTPVEGMTWVYDQLYMPYSEGKIDNIFIVEVDQDDNPYLDRQGKDNAATLLSEDERATRKSGRFAAKGGFIFKEFLETAHVRPPFLPNKDWRIYVSIDHGWNNPTAVLWHAVHEDGNVITFHEYYVHHKTVKEIANSILGINATLNLEVYLYTGDPAMAQGNGITGTNVIQEYALNGIGLAIEGVPRSVGIGIDKMRSYLKVNRYTKRPYWMITENCPNLIRQMKHVHWKTYNSAKLNDQNNVRDEVHKKDDHAFDSARYFFTLMPDLAPNSADTISGLIKGLHEAEKKEIELGSYFDTLLAIQEFKKLDTPIESIQTRWHTLPVGHGSYGESSYEVE
jgi:phage terminase large subunit-like protein